MSNVKHVGERDSIMKRTVAEGMARLGDPGNSMESGIMVVPELAEKPREKLANILETVAKTVCSDID